MYTTGIRDIGQRWPNREIGRTCWNPNENVGRLQGFRWYGLACIWITKQQERYLILLIAMGTRISFSNCTFFFGIIRSLTVSSFNFQGQMFSQEVKLGTFYGVLCLFDSKNCFVVLCCNWNFCFLVLFVFLLPQSLYISFTSYSK